MRVLKQSEVQSVSGGFLFLKLALIKKGLFFRKTAHHHPKHPPKHYHHGKGY